jgi:hypothetical protein
MLNKIQHVATAPLPCAYKGSTVTCNCSFCKARMQHHEDFNLVFTYVPLHCPQAITAAPLAVWVVHSVQFTSIGLGCHQCWTVIHNGKSNTRVRNFSRLQHCVNNKLLLFQIGYKPMLFPHCLVTIMGENLLCQLVYDPV